MKITPELVYYALQEAIGLAEGLSKENRDMLETLQFSIPNCTVTQTTPETFLIKEHSWIIQMPGDQE